VPSFQQLAEGARRCFNHWGPLGDQPEVAKPFHVQVYTTNTPSHKHRESLILHHLAFSGPIED